MVSKLSFFGSHGFNPYCLFVSLIYWVQLLVQRWYSCSFSLCLVLLYCFSTRESVNVATQFYLPLWSPSENKIDKQTNSFFSFLPWAPKTILPGPVDYSDSVRFWPYSPTSEHLLDQLSTSFIRPGLATKLCHLSTNFISLYKCL